MAVAHVKDKLHVSLIPKYYNAAMCMRESGAVNIEGTKKMLSLVIRACARDTRDRGEQTGEYVAYCEMAIYWRNETQKSEL